MQVLKILGIITFGLFIACNSTGNLIEKPTDNTVQYHIDLSDIKNDEFKVTVHVQGLSDNNGTFLFISTLPGNSFEIFDFGRLVTDFTAYRQDGVELEVKHPTINEWQIMEVQKLRRLEYSIKDSYEDIDVTLMVGTSIDSDHAVINPAGILGYFNGLNNHPSTLGIGLPASWQLGSSIEKNMDGLYLFKSFNQVAESQFLAGNITRASENFDGIDIDIYSYSSNNLIDADQLMDYSKEVLESAGKFLDFQVSKHYSFFFVFRDRASLSTAISKREGANASKLSSMYALREDDLSKGGIVNIISHEFMHIISINNEHFYRYHDPIPSRHLWLQEGATEWAANIMQLRNQKTVIDDYLNVISRGLRKSDQYSNDISLSEIGLKSFTENGKKNYSNIYYKGHVACVLLDIRLLELTNGKSGLRELLIRLYEQYGDSYFMEENLFDLIIAMTHPEIEDFINRYIKGIEPLPVSEYFAKLGIEYFETRISDSKPALGMRVDNDFKINGLDKRIENLEIGDMILAVNGKKLTRESSRGIIDDIYENRKAGDILQLELIRKGENLTVDFELLQDIGKHVLTIKENPTEKEQLMQARWLRN